MENDLLGPSFKKTIQTLPRKFDLPIFDIVKQYTIDKENLNAQFKKCEKKSLDYVNSYLKPDGENIGFQKTFDHILVDALLLS